MFQNPAVRGLETISLLWLARFPLWWTKQSLFVSHLLRLVHDWLHFFKRTKKPIKQQSCEELKFGKNLIPHTVNRAFHLITLDYGMDSLLRVPTSQIRLLNDIKKIGIYKKKKKQRPTFLVCGLSSLHHTSLSCTLLILGLVWHWWF